MSETTRLFRSALGRQMSDVRRKRGVDPRTGAPYPEMTEAEALAEHAKLGVCHQHEGGPCRLHVTRDPNDKRCRVSTRMVVSCPYLGKPAPLKAVLEEEEEERKLEEMTIEAPPKVDW